MLANDWLRAGRSGDRIPVGRDFPPVQTGPWAHPASCTIGTVSFLGVESGQGVLLTNNPLLVPRSWKSRAIPLPTLSVTTGPVTGNLTFILQYARRHFRISFNLRTPKCPPVQSTNLGKCVWINIHMTWLWLLYWFWYYWKTVPLLQCHLTNHRISRERWGWPMRNVSPYAVSPCVLRRPTRHLYNLLFIAFYQCRYRNTETVPSARTHPLFFTSSFAKYHNIHFCIN